MVAYHPGLPLSNRVLYHVADFLLKLFGWKVQGTLPATRKYVLIATHTSNWDFVFAMLALSLLTNGLHNFPLRWFGKKELFRGPFYRLFRHMGGVPIDRKRGQDVVRMSVEEFGKSEALVMLITPEGTRKRSNCWRSGFYHIAHGAGVPVVCGFLNYQEKVVGLGPVLRTSGDIDADMVTLRGFYSRIPAKFPDQVAEVKVRPEPGIAR